MNTTFIFASLAVSAILAGVFGLAKLVGLVDLAWGWMWGVTVVGPVVVVVVVKGVVAKFHAVLGQ